MTLCTESDSYGAQRIGTVQHVWSPVDGNLVVTAGVKAAHIFPLSLGQRVMTYIFGPEANGEINFTKNGLFLPPLVGSAFDRHQIVIVPVEGNMKPQEWKILVLNKGGLWNIKITSRGKTFGDLHQAKLQFPANNDFRPRTRYFYFHYVLAMLRIGRRKQKERAGSSSQMASVTTPQEGDTCGRT
jgi:hypothetical protein